MGDGGCGDVYRGMNHVGTVVSSDKRWSCLKGRGLAWKIG